MIKGGFVLDKAVHVAVITFDDNSISLTTDEGDSKSIITDRPIDIKAWLDVISLRFSSNSGNGVLISASGDNGQDGYRLEIINGRLRLEIRMDGAAKTIECGRDLDDGQWRTIMIRRDKRVATLELRTSNDQKVPNCDSKVEVSTMVEKMKLQNFVIGAGKSKPQFNGTIQKLKFNGNELIEQCRAAQDQQKSLPDGFTCSMPNRPKINTQMPNPSNPFTFLTREAFQRTDSKIRADILWKSSRKYQVQIELRTTEEDGLIFWAGPADLVNQDERTLILDQINKKAKDPNVSWAILEIVNGRVHWIWKLKRRAPQVMTSNKVISDNDWHSIQIDVTEGSVGDRSSAWDINIDKGRSQAEQLPLRNIGPKGKWEGFLDNSAVLVGGLPKYLWGTTGSPVTSTEGFLGCVGKIQLNGNTMFLERRARQIQKGCSGPLVACSAFYCKNGGLCRQGWDGPKCDCSGTSFIGDTCTKLVGGRGEFSRAVVLVPLPSEDSLSTDLISVLIQVPDKDTAQVTNTEPISGLRSPKNETGTVATVQTILSVASSGTNDALKLTLEDGRPKFVYDIGGGETTMKYPKRIDDGQYHQIRIKRVESNATMIVDDLPAVTSSGNNKYSVFNSQSEIQIGGRLTDNDVILDPFKGKILGVNFNKFKVLEAVQKGESKAARIIGDVTVSAIESNFDPKIPTSTTQPPTTTTAALVQEITSYSLAMNDSAGFSNATMTKDPDSSTLTTTFFTVAFAAGVLLVLIVAGLVFYRFRRHSKDDIPAVVPGIKPKPQKGNQPPGKNSEFYV
ncbi:Oidioi.mRNA.OKI2018_I69.chr1.g2385.t1.cds [Oikopleura dioica]|uniref:Oidioi.mRNA.OKI2018_I69.chr1.g2385.t1.cds n=1 Tax=Oikopleura dioica TaxID=34765 RepID=A0ABN7SSN5_OIKDI|nr:Oidioi.mRNA.OKI2018_I69.chr1.g2385.t1.cds [Oikopleura dioica]